MKQIIPLEHVVVALREPVIVLDGERYFVVASAWTPKELEVIDFDDDAFGHRLIRIGAVANNSYPRKPRWQKRRILD